VNTSVACRFYDVVDVPDPSHSAGAVGAQEAALDACRLNTKACRSGRGCLMTTTCNMWIHRTEIMLGIRGKLYCRWAVDRQRWKKPFKSAALTERFRSELVAASRK
jgi:hypothetical protein